MTTTHRHLLPLALLCSTLACGLPPSALPAHGEADRVDRVDSAEVQRGPDAVPAVSCTIQGLPESVEDIARVPGGLLVVTPHGGRSRLSRFHGDGCTVMPHPSAPAAAMQAGALGADDIGNAYVIAHGSDDPNVIATTTGLTGVVRVSPTGEVTELVMGGRWVETFSISADGHALMISQSCGPTGLFTEGPDGWTHDPLVSAQAVGCGATLVEGPSALLAITGRGIDRIDANGASTFSSAELGLADGPASLATALSRCGSAVCGASADGFARWDLATGEQIMTLSRAAIGAFDDERIVRVVGDDSAHHVLLDGVAGTRVVLLPLADP